MIGDDELLIDSAPRGKIQACTSLRYRVKLTVVGYAVDDALYDFRRYVGK